MSIVVVTPDGVHLHASNTDCSHSNDDVCPTCDFDRYYARKYGALCPWAPAVAPEGTQP